jgi:hypothetical protein
MPSNKDKLDQSLAKASLDFETFARELASGRNNKLIDDDLGKPLTSLVESLRAQLVVLKLLAGNVEAPRSES